MTIPVPTTHPDGCRNSSGPLQLFRRRPDRVDTWRVSILSSRAPAARSCIKLQGPMFGRESLEPESSLEDGKGAAITVGLGASASDHPAGP